MRVRYVVLYVNDAEACRRFWVEQVGMVEKDRKEIADKFKEAKRNLQNNWMNGLVANFGDDEGNEHPLTASEFGLLKVFAANPKRVLSRERLLKHVADGNRVYVHFGSQGTAALDREGKVLWRNSQLMPIWSLHFQ